MLLLKCAHMIIGGVRQRFLDTPPMNRMHDHSIKYLLIITVISVADSTKPLLTIPQILTSALSLSFWYRTLEALVATKNHSSLTSSRQPQQEQQRPIE